MMTETELQVKVKVVLPEMVCQNCKRWYIAYQDGRGRCSTLARRGIIAYRNGTCESFSPKKVEVEDERNKAEAVSFL